MKPITKQIIKLKIIYKKLLQIAIAHYNLNTQFFSKRKINEKEEEEEIIEKKKKKKIDDHHDYKQRYHEIKLEHDIPIP